LSIPNIPKAVYSSTSLDMPYSLRWESGSL
jgi:hypothetical protein